MQITHYYKGRLTEIQAPRHPWPRHWYNFPIILCGIALQYLWCAAIAWDSSVLDVTSISPLVPYFHQAVPHAHPDYFQWIMVVVIFITATTSATSFCHKKKLHTVLALVPQQFIMVISSVGAFHSIYAGQFADGVIRPHAFLVADQSPIILLTIFHTWAMILILRHAKDRK